MIRFAALALALVAPAAAAAEPAKPLFAADETLRLTVRGPVNYVARNAERSNEARAATLVVGAESLPVRLSPRGITRRRKETCTFPPLRVDFAGVPAATSVFAGQRRLKLVTHCRSGEGFQQFLLLEYAAYRLYNLLTANSLKVRLAQIDYVDDGGRPIISRLGFFIEDPDDAARRNGLREARMGARIPVTQLVPADAGRAAVFEYLIGNLDWAMNAGPPGDSCCHNFKLFAAPGGAFLPVPYDFDFSGLVDAPYATPPELVKVSSVRERRYRGFCRHNAQAIAAAAEARARRPELLALLGSIPQLDERSRRKAAAYLERGFADIADDRQVSDKLLRTCLG